MQGDECNDFGRLGANLGAQALVRVCASVCVGTQALKTGAWRWVCVLGVQGVCVGAQASVLGAWAVHRLEEQVPLAQQPTHRKIQERGVQHERTPYRNGLDPSKGLLSESILTS
ncbi:hypothetical protein PIB30_054470 [Stylosanthes scabra]|uniref:Uncharacterized protein n=1 Tax=Stylosanthes scabra TaxID=79078 RepID=A0ABU6WJA0_9FABA|nr:hypothetical protein [Stylosanthes scabra]